MFQQVEAIRSGIAVACDFKLKRAALSARGPAGASLLHKVNLHLPVRNPSASTCGLSQKALIKVRDTILPRTYLNADAIYITHLILHASIETQNMIGFLLAIQASFYGQNSV